MSKEIHQQVALSLEKLAGEIYSQIDSVPSHLYDALNLSQELFLQNINLFIISGGIVLGALGISVALAVRDDLSEAIDEEKKAEELNLQIEARTNPEIITVKEERLKAEILTLDNL